MVLIAENKAVVHSLYPPVVFDSIHEPGKRYLIADGKWHDIHDGITYSNVVWFRRPSVNGRHEAFQPTAEWEVDGSKGKKYIVTASKNSWSCDCPAYGWSGAKRSCKHIEKIKKENGW